MTSRGIALESCLRPDRYLGDHRAEADVGGRDGEGPSDVGGEDDAEPHEVPEVCVGGPHLSAGAPALSETHLNSGRKGSGIHTQPRLVEVS